MRDDRTHPELDPVGERSPLRGEHLQESVASRSRGSGPRLLLATLHTLTQRQRR